MKEELQGKLVEILTSIQTAAGKASDFALAELPDIAQSYIVYGRVAESAGFALLLALALLSAFVALRYGYLNHAAVHTKEYRVGDWKDGRVVAAIAGTALAVLFALISSVQSAQMFLVWFAPKVWLLKEIAGLLK